MIDKAHLLAEVKADFTLARRLQLGLSDVIDEREVHFQLPGDRESPYTSRRGFDRWFLRREGCEEQQWYRVWNGLAGGYVSDSRALEYYLQGGEQMELEEAA